MHMLKLLTAIALVSACVPAATAQAATNEDACLESTWGYLRAIGYEFGATNTCTYPLLIRFKPRSGPQVEKMVEPGKTFSTGLTIDKFESDRKKSGWVATVCRAGDLPAQEISDGSWDAILDGKYECRKP
jgi:hypothetical protein